MAAVAGKTASAAVRSLLWRRTALLSSVRCPVRFKTSLPASPDAGLPGPYPRTPEERAAAAEKYGMRLEDYEPYPDDGMGYGDYPMLPPQGSESRDPWVDWDDKWHRTNYGDVPHIHMDAYTRQRINPDQNYVIPWRQMVAALFGFFGFSAFMLYLGQEFHHVVPVAPKQYPYNNLYLDKGGDPDKMPAEEVKHYEFPSS